MKGTPVVHLSEPIDFELVLLDGGKYRVSKDGKQCKFTAPASTRGVAKLYTVSADQELLYVGIAQQPMSARLAFGFRAAGRGGYHGYKWRDLRHPLKLTVWTADDEGRPVDARTMETIEAEVAYLCRHRGNWPRYQHEIHFHHSDAPHQAAAMKIYEHATRPPRVNIAQQPVREASLVIKQPITPEYQKRQLLIVDLTRGGGRNADVAE